MAEALFPPNRDKRTVETSLIRHFHYPKLGPGQMWESVGSEVLRLGGTIISNTQVTGISFEEGRVTSVTAVDQTGAVKCWNQPKWVLSSMPIKDLLGEAKGIPDPIREVAAGLQYRDFITVGLLVRKLCPDSGLNLRPDNWLYVQEPGIRMGRVQIFNNWSPYLVADPSTTWLGLEYFANEGDDLWTMADEDLIRLAAQELQALGIASAVDVLDQVVVRQPKAYPAYFGTYSRMDEIRNFTDGVENLLLVGRNGAHRYNNQDHSMLAAMTAVDLILDPSRSKSEIWSVNTEEAYHESPSEPRIPDSISADNTQQQCKLSSPVR